MRRRDFIALVGGAAAWPVSARAQQNSPTIGYLSVRTAEGDVPMVNAVRQGLKDAGYVEGSSVSIEYRFASGQYDRLVVLAEDLVHRNVAVIITGGGESAVFTAKAATSRIPIVFNIAEDPVQMGLVASLNRPGGNMAGVTSLLGALGTKQLGLIRELVPKTAVIALLVDPQVAPRVEALIAGTETAARATGQKLLVFRASSDGELEAALAAIAQQQAGALLVPASPYLYTRRERLIAFAARQALPAIYSRREHALAGGLMSYGTSTEELYGQVGLYAGRILSGVKPADLPVVQATRFELVINVRTAKTLGLEIPPTLLARADEVIE